MDKSAGAPLSAAGLHAGCWAPASARPHMYIRHMPEGEDMRVMRAWLGSGRGLEEVIRLALKRWWLVKDSRGQVMILVVLQTYLGTSAANYAKSLLRYTVLLQYIPRIIRFLPFLGWWSASGFIFESAWANFAINLLIFILAGHVVGSCWYLFGLQRVNQCLRDACSSSHISNCKIFLDCGRGYNINLFNQTPAWHDSWHDWLNNSNSNSCFDTSSDGRFDYGIYQRAVLLTTKQSVITRYIYSLVWGFQQISTLGGNLVPSYFEGEVLFTMAIVGLGLLLFALLIGNMQKFLQALGRRNEVLTPYIPGSWKVFD